MTNLIDSLTDPICDRASNFIIAHPDRILTARFFLAIARLTDRHDAYHAAHIRDTIRDNCDLTRDELLSL